MSKSILILAASLDKISVCPPLQMIQVGCTNTQKHLCDVLHDDDGCNISEKNPYYCELTAHYWAWKNTQNDFVGFLHHRRYFSFEENKICDKTHSRKIRPYIIYNYPDEETLKKICFTEADLERMTERYEIIAPTGENLYETVTQQYSRFDKNASEELKLLQTLIDKHYPQYSSAANNYLNGKRAYFCNMFIMRRDLFENYCTTLFDILEHMDDLRTVEQRRLRDNGMIAERFFGVYFTYIRQETQYRWAEVPRVHFSDLGGASKNKSFSRFWYKIAPPGSVRRAILRRL